MIFLRCTHNAELGAPKAPQTRGVWGHGPPDNFEIKGLGNANTNYFRGTLFYVNATENAVTSWLLYHSLEFSVYYSKKWGKTMMKTEGLQAEGKTSTLKTGELCYTCKAQFRRRTFHEPNLTP